LKEKKKKEQMKTLIENWAPWAYPLNQVTVSSGVSTKRLEKGRWEKWCARASWLGTPVALKQTHFLHPTNRETAAIVESMSEEERASLLRTFLKECHTLAQLRHPNVVLFLGLVVDLSTKNCSVLILHLDLKDLISSGRASTFCNLSLYLLGGERSKAKTSHLQSAFKS
jgi:serine/threonine protein kinase